MKLVFATNNMHKLQEAREVLRHHGLLTKISGLKEIGCNTDIPETAPSLEGNALQKAVYVSDRYGTDCFADDTGLEIEALGGRPGVYSARYAGEGCSFDDNIDKILAELGDRPDRKAAFRTVICLIIHGEIHYFEGRVEGNILHARKGKGGFGYDPVFQPAGHEKTFAEMNMEEKNRLSHRGNALRKMVQFLAKER
ncbi:MAG TPA: RdgB/HAM1 family non-canonical purine NTP pyrophosphatase [Bacteroidales bacterium]|nr:RdgB/HAM1 family non-canonical purine NTP pyrophosphatase [Bacteroidales bacterium]HSA42330.1 RdgB/HAM1 family non-canonical purine NTP pyrophosphatase [Bacteroidales bacterium]